MLIRTNKVKKIHNKEDHLDSKKIFKFNLKIIKIKLLEQIKSSQLSH